VLRIKQANLPLAKFIVDDFGLFDPKHPDPIPAQFDLPPDLSSNRLNSEPRGGAAPAASLPSSLPAAIDSGSKMY
jgi:hypothetical protein